MVRLALLRFFESYFRHRWLYLLPLVLMVALAAAYQVYAPVTYFASGTIYIQKQSLLTSLTSGGGGFSWTTPAQATVGELRELLQTDAFARSAIKATPLEAEMSSGPQAVQQAIADFRSAIDFQVLGDNLVMISAKHAQPQAAQQFVKAMMDTYVQWKLNIDNQESVVAQDFFAKILQPYEDELEKTRADMRAYLLAHPDPVRGERPTEEQLQINQFQAAIDQAQERVKSTMEKLENARLSQSKAESEVRQSYGVVDAPTLPPKPDKRLKDRAREIAIFVAVGLMLCLIGVIGGMVLDQSLRFPIDARVQLGLSTLAVIPNVAAAIVKIRDRLPRMVVADAAARNALLRDPIVRVQPDVYPNGATAPGSRYSNGHGQIVVSPTPPSIVVLETLHPEFSSNGHNGNGNGAHRMQKLSFETVDDAVMAELQRRYDQSNDVTMRLHYQIVTLAHRGRSVSQIADTLFYSREAVEYVLQQFLNGGIDAIPHILPKGMRRIAVPEWEAELLRVINSSPRTLGIDSERWTTKRLAEYLAEELHVRVRPETISLCLHRHGYACRSRVWRREQEVEEPLAMLEAPQSVGGDAMNDDLLGEAQHEQ